MLEANLTQIIFLIYGSSPDAGFHHTIDWGDCIFHEGVESLLPCEEAHSGMYKNANHKQKLKFVKTKLELGQFGQIQCYIQEGKDQFKTRHNKWGAEYHYRGLIKRKGIKNIDELLAFTNSKFPTFQFL